MTTMGLGKHHKPKIYILWMAWRHMTSRKGRSLSFMTTISILGVSIGVAALVVVLSVVGGFEQDLKAKMFRGLPHMSVMAENALAGFSLDQYKMTDFEGLFPDAVGVEPFTEADVVIKRRRHLASVTLFGIDPARGGHLWGFSQGMTQGSLEDLGKTGDELRTSPEDDPLPGIVLGEQLAIQLGAEVGDEVQILSPQASVTDALGGGSSLAAFRVTGIFMTDLPRYDSKYAVVSLAQGRKFMPDYDPSLEAEHYVTGVAVNISEPTDIDDYVERLKKFPELKALTWQTTYKSLLFALKLEKFTMGAILLLIVLVAAFSISGTMMMMVYHKRSQVALMRALGMEQKDIARLFIAHGCTIGSVGVLFGILIGIALCALIYYFQFINLPKGVYYLPKLPVRFLPLEYVAISFCAWCLSLLAAVYPALVAARQDPGTGLRFL